MPKSYLGKWILSFTHRGLQSKYKTGQKKTWSLLSNQKIKSKDVLYFPRSYCQSHRSVIASGSGWGGSGEAEKFPSFCPHPQPLVQGLLYYRCPLNTWSRTNEREEVGKKGWKRLRWNNWVTEYCEKFRALIPGWSSIKFSFGKTLTAFSQPPHGALITKESWADLGKHFWFLLWIRSLRPAILLFGDSHWGRRGEGKALLEIQLVLHKEWCTWKIDHDTALGQILLIMQYLNTQYIPLNDEKKSKVTANKSHFNETKRKREFLHVDHSTIVSSLPPYSRVSSISIKRGSRAFLNTANHYAVSEKSRTEDYLTSLFSISSPVKCK